jgi:hypothetical protein
MQVALLVGLLAAACCSTALSASFGCINAEGFCKPSSVIEKYLRNTINDQSFQGLIQTLGCTAYDSDCVLINKIFNCNFSKDSNRKFDIFHNLLSQLHLLINMQFVQKFLS